MVTDEVLLALPGYELHQRLGKGGMAEVYLATQRSLKRKVALKVLSASSEEGVSERFVQEAHIIASLQHPSIITIYDIGQLSDGRYYLAMEYLSGGDLAQFRGQAFEPARALEITRQIASGLAVVHEQGLIHRDIKPANILLRDDGSVVITDFGVAKAVEIDTELTHDGIAIGSPAYTSPEQTRCLAVDLRTDIYSLGVTLLEMLLGYNPYKGASYTDSVMQHLQMPVPTLPKPLALYQPLLERMLAKEPQQRFANCYELIEVLTALGAEDPDATQIRPKVLLAADAPRPAKRGLRSAVQWGLGLVLLTLGGVLGWQFYQDYQQQQQNELWLGLAEERLAAGKLMTPAQDSADFYFRQVLAHDADNAQALAGLQAVLEKRLERLLLRAERRFEEDKLLYPEDDGAVFYYRQVLGWSPDDPRARAGLQKVAQRYGQLSEAAYARYDYEQARKLIEHALEVDPDSAELFNRLANHGTRVSELETARRERQKANIRREPESRVREVGNSIKKMFNDVFD